MTPDIGQIIIPQWLFLLIMAFVIINAFSFIFTGKGTLLGIDKIISKILDKTISGIMRMIEKAIMAVGRMLYDGITALSRLVYDAIRKLLGI